MEGEWVTIGEIAKIYDGPHATPKKVGDGPYFLSISSLVGGKLDLSKSPRISEEQFEKWTRRVTPKPGDLLFSYETRLGEAALMPEGVKACLGRRMGLLRPNKNKVDPKYFLFAFLGPDFQQEIKKRTIYGATVERIALRELPEFPIRLPPLPKQRAIAHILGTLDDKIELNRQMNRTLEAMAQALFKSWFIDFDPVVVNALHAGNPVPEKFAQRAAHYRDNPRALSLPEDTLRQFPDRFQDSELGPIPEGWKKGCVAEFGDVVCGKTPPTKDKANYGEDVPFIKIPDMHGKVYVTSTEIRLSQKGAETQSSKYIPPNSVCVSCIATPGLVVLTSSVSQTNQQINTVVPKSTSPYYVFCALRRLGEQIRAGGSGGSVFSNLNKSRFSALRVLLPERRAVDIFHIAVEMWFENMLANDKQSHTLTTLRDTLLPKLISGELCVPDAEKLLEASL